MIIAAVLPLAAQQPAFPGAEGGGMYAMGGRGGKVYYVNSLEDTKEGDKATGEGTLRWCLDREGPKTILFKVAGIIRLKSLLNIRSNTTIAGQSAPGDGICIADNYVKIAGDNIIVRFVRFRLGDLLTVENDAFTGRGFSDIIIDHCSMSWATDECASFYDNKNFTMQWCILSESLTRSVHVKGSHGYGGIWGGQRATFHHNLLAHHDSRNPRMCGSRYTGDADAELVDFRNNVIYNWGSNSGYAGEGGSYNIVGNYYKPSQYSSNRDRIFAPNADDGGNKQQEGVWGKFYVADNFMHGDRAVTVDNTLGFQPKPATKDKSELLVAAPFDTPLVTTHTAKQAYDLVLKCAGASMRRDATDTRVVNEVAKGRTPVKTTDPTSKTRPGLIDSQREVGGWDTYSFKPEDVATPDAWLTANHPGKSLNDIAPDGYTYLEAWLNGLVGQVMN